MNTIVWSCLAANLFCCYVVVLNSPGADAEAHSVTTESLLCIGRASKSTEREDHCPDIPTLQATIVTSKTAW